MPDWQGPAKTDNKEVAFTSVEKKTMNNTLAHCPTVALINRIRNAPMGMTMREVADQLVDAGEDPGTVFLAYTAAKILDKDQAKR